MSTDLNLLDPDNPRIRAALTELQELIARHYPEAEFEVTRGFDPAGVYLKAIIDVDDIDEVTPVFLERMMELEIDEGLPVYVIPLQPPEKVLVQIRAKAAREAEARRKVS